MHATFCRTREWTDQAVDIAYDLGYSASSKLALMGYSRRRPIHFAKLPKRFMPIAVRGDLHVWVTRI